jgi:hypothetical protein
MSNKLLGSTKENLVLAAKGVEEGGGIVAPGDINLALTLNPWREEGNFKQKVDVQ